LIDNVLQFPPGYNGRAALECGTDATAIRLALLPAGAALESKELAVIAWAARLAEGISTICLRDGNASLSLQRAYERFKDLAYLADLTGSIARYSRSGSFSAEMREAFLGIVVENLVVVAGRFEREFPVGWFANGTAAAAENPAKSIT